MKDTPAVPRSDLLAFGVTIFTGAFLLFQVQPLIGKYILPWFGGTPSVWTTCLLFFQCLLLAGYGYAHLLTRLPLKKQAIVHLSLLAISLLFLPIQPSEALQPTPGGNPAWQIFVLLAATIGLPYLVLSATGPLMQSWFSRKFEGRSPYRLYALSNVGSMLALVSYPFLVEPYTTRDTQVWSWSIGLGLFAIVCGTVAWNMRRVEEAADESPVEKPLPKISRGALLLWLLLPACGTAQLMATTNKITQDVAIIPFLWVLPLSLYLLSFIICFDSPRRYSRAWFSRGLFLCWVGIVWALHEGADADLILQVVIFSAALFFGCMICHGELYRLRPPAVRLTQYFLVIAAGGALGGLFVALLAPLVFVDYWEFHLALWGCGALLVAVCFFNNVKWNFTRWHLRIALALCFLAAYWGLSAAFEVKYAGTENPVLVQRGVPAGQWLEVAALLGGAMVLTWLMSHALDAWIRSSTKVRMAAAVTGSGWMLGLIQPLLWITGGSMEVAPWALLAAWALMAAIGFVWFSIGGWRGIRLSSGWTWSLLAVVLGVVLFMHAVKSQKDVVRQTRNFYGVLKIFDYGMKAGDPMRGHQGTVRVLARDLSTRSLASADDAGMIRVWDYESGRTLRVLQEHQGPVRAICFSSDGQWLVSTGSDRTVRLWEVDAEREKRVMKVDAPVNAVACNPGDQWVAVGDEEGVIRILEFGSFETAVTLPGHDGPVRSLAFDITSNRLLSAGQDGVIKIWDVDTRQLITEMKGHKGTVNQAAFGQNGSLVVSAGADGTARVWHASDGRPRHVLRGHAGPVLSAAVDTRDSRVATAGADGVKIWDLTDGRAICTLAGEKVSNDARATLFLPPTASAWTDFSSRLDRVVTAQGNTLHVWNLDLHQRRIRNGRITHGMQYTHPDLAQLQTTYYGPSSGVGVALGWLRPAGRTIGVVGLGSGTIAAYGKKGDHVWFYDIDPDVEKVAKSHFTYLRDCERRGAEVKVVLGDARMSLKHDRVPRSKFDLLVLDAFSSDAIPAHLLTREAIGVYQRHMSDDGIIAIHVSNRHLNLSGVVLDISREAGLVPIRVYHDGEDSFFDGRAIDAFWRTDWILLARPSLLVDNPAARRMAYEHHFYFKQKLAEWASRAGIPENRLGEASVGEVLEMLQEDPALEEQWPMIKTARKVARTAQAGNQPFAGHNTAEFLRASHGHPEMRLWTDDYVSLYRILNTPDWWDDLKASWHGWWD